MSITDFGQERYYDFSLEEMLLNVIHWSDFQIDKDELFQEAQKVNPFILCFIAETYFNKGLYFNKVKEK